MFTTTPDNFAISRDGFIFEFEPDDGAKDLIAYIRDGDDMTLYGTKRYYDAAHADINVMPYIKEAIEPKPLLAASGNYGDIVSAKSVYVICDMEDCDAVMVANNSAELREDGVQSIFGTSRTIGGDEQDIISLVVNGGDSVRIKIRSYDEGEWKLKTNFVISASYINIYNVVISAMDFDSGSEQLEFNYNYASGDSVSIFYTNTLRLPESCRIAWINRYGGFEHYTFESRQGESIDNDGVHHYHYLSAFESYDNLLLLGEIISAEYIWRVDKDGYHRIELEGDGFSLVSDGEISCGEIKFHDYV